MNENNNNHISSFTCDIRGSNVRCACAGNINSKRNYEIILGIKGRAKA